MGISHAPHDEAELLHRARRGDGSAVAALYDAYLSGARRLAVILAGAERADDLVADAFTRVLSKLSAGHGPTDNFRGYLFTTIRNRHRDLLRKGQHEAPASDRPWIFDHACPGVDDLLEAHDETAVAAFGCLPDRWQQILWQLEIEGRPVSEVAAQLGLRPTALTSLACRAREGLRTAYLQQQVSVQAMGDECRWITQRLGRYVRGQLSQRGHGRVAAHLPVCRACRTTVTRLTEVNQRLGGGLVVETAS